MLYGIVSFRAAIRSLLFFVFVILVIPPTAFARPYCICRVRCTYDTSSICLVGGGSTTATAYYNVRFNYQVDAGDPHGSTLTTAASYENDCSRSSGIAQSSLEDYADDVCGDKVSTLAWLNSFGYAHSVTLMNCRYEAAR